MITPRKNTERRHIESGKHNTWLTFYPRKPPPSPTGVPGVLTAFDEMRIPPDGVIVPHPREEAEIVTYTYRGALAQEDSTGNSGVLHAGEFQRMIVAPRIRHKETNPSSTDWTHVFRIYLHPAEVGLDCVHEQKRFLGAQRHNVLCVVASPDGRKGSLRVLQDALIYSSIIDPGHHLIHELLPGRSAWLHVLEGEVSLQDIILTGGDGVGVTSEPSVSITAQENTEILLIDAGPTVRSR